MISGSLAVNLNRPINDIDMIVTENDYINYINVNKNDIKEIGDTKWGHFVKFHNRNLPVEFEIVEKHESSKLLYEMYKGLEKLDESAILALKLSHRFLKNSPHFLKTMRDIHFLRNNGVVLTNDLQNWLKIREKETYDYSHPSLNKKKIEFFKDDFYVYDHDSIHESVALLNVPAYEFIKEDKKEVKTSKQKFDEVDEYIKILTVYEESAVLALERGLIPNDFKLSSEKMFLTALQKVCTSISSGWWREYAWENYYVILLFWEKIGKNKYVDDFLQAKNNNKLRLWKDYVKEVK